MRGAHRWLPLTLLLLAGCGGGGTSTGGTHPSSQGVLWLSWTLKGADVADATCHNIDHIVLTMDTPSGTIEIEPIPCLRGLGWEYDGLPEGFSLVILDAFGTTGPAMLEGAANVTLTDTKPAMPSPIDLQPR
jgi:hypothetical protein